MKATKIHLVLSLCKGSPWIDLPQLPLNEYISPSLNRFVLLFH